VQIKPFLNSQTNVTLFRVQADQPAYWRLTSLNHFDGTTWSSQGTYYPASGTLATPSIALSTATIHQRYTIASLGGIWVPAAYQPTRVSGVSASIDPASQTMIVSALHQGTTYDVLSSAPIPTGDQLAAAGAATAPSAEDLTVPRSTIDTIGPIATAITGSSATAYAKAVALQGYLRTFTYDDQVPAGSSDNYLLDFLTKSKRGFCEQFAGSMAVMLRLLGIPARVAVGFLPGSPNASVASPGSLVGPPGYVVTGKQAHAWPEAYFSGIGWVSFEPTPRPDAPPPGYTVSPATPAVPAEPAAPTPVASATPSIAPSIRPTAQPTQAAKPVHTRRPMTAAERAAFDLLIAFAVLLLGLYVAREVRLRLPGWLARTPQEKALAAYDELSLRAADAAAPRQPGETEAEYARSLVQSLSVPAAQVVAVTGAYQKAAYSLRTLAWAELHAALRANRALRLGIWKRADWRGKTRLVFSPRPLYARPRTRYEPRPNRAPRSSSAPSAARRV
jgi:transglutaminase-like putative cysteine protease